MFNPDFWRLLDLRVTVYAEFLKQSANEDKYSHENQDKTERQQYEDKLDRLIDIKTFYDKFYFNFDF
jgi:hypothetical protein